MNTPMDIARLSLLSGGVLLLLLGPRTVDWNWVAVLAVCTGAALGWAQSKYGPASSTPDNVVPRAVFVTGLVCIGIRVWLALS